MLTPKHTSDKKQSVAEFLLEFAASNAKDVPAVELEKLPTDGALNHDHYLYGSPKK
jgi:hypothetical protein